MGLIDRLRQRLGRSEKTDQVAPSVIDAARPAGEMRDTGWPGRSVAPRLSLVAPVHPPGSPLTHPRFAVVDVETTGLSAAAHRIIEIAVVTTDPHGKVLDSWSSRLNPEGPVGATHIHGITDRDVVHAPRFQDVVAALNARLAGAALAGHNARFDLAFLRAEYARAGWRMPFVPALCTLEASTHHLPDLPRRRLVDVCAAVGLPPHRAHSALGDASATAALLATFLHPGRPPRQVDLDLPDQGHAVLWPTASEGSPLPVPVGDRADGRRLSEQARRNMAAAAAAPAAKPLVQLISRFSLIDAREEGASAGSVAYLEKLAEVLEDGILDPTEAAALVDVADSYELAATHVEAAHLAFVRALAREAMADGKLTRAERAELASVAVALDVPASAVTEVLTEAKNHHLDQHSSNLRPLPDGWAYGEPLRVGDRVVFTGCDPAVRHELEAASEAAGVRVMNGVASTTAMLITDGSMEGGKARRAAELGTRVVAPDVYRDLLEHLQPAAPRGAPPRSGGSASALVSQQPASPVAVTSDEVGNEAGGPTPAELRAWGRRNGWVLGDRGRLPKELREAFDAAHSTG